MEMTVEQMALDERKFLHDLSNQLVVAQGMGAIVMRSLNELEEGSIDPKIIERLDKGNKAIDKMIALIKERRVTLHSHSK